MSDRPGFWPADEGLELPSDEETMRGSKTVRELRAAGAGRSGRSDISERIEEMLREETVNHPRHYNAHPSGLECLVVVRLCSFDLGNALKYIWRYEHKRGDEDLRKARFYLNDVLATGQAHYPPVKARTLLQEVIKHETNSTRRELFLHILTGGLREAVDLITTIVGEEQ